MVITGDICTEFCDAALQSALINEHLFNILVNIVVHLASTSMIGQLPHVPPPTCCNFTKFVRAWLAMGRPPIITTY